MTNTDNQSVRYITDNMSTYESFVNKGVVDATGYANYMLQKEKNNNPDVFNQRSNEQLNSRRLAYINRWRNLEKNYHNDLLVTRKFKDDPDMFINYSAMTKINSGRYERDKNNTNYENFIFSCFDKFFNVSSKLTNTDIKTSERYIDIQPFSIGDKQFAGDVRSNLLNLLNGDVEYLNSHFGTGKDNVYKIPNNKEDYIKFAQAYGKAFNDNANPITKSIGIAPSINTANKFLIDKDKDGNRFKNQDPHLLLINTYNEYNNLKNKLNIEYNDGLNEPVQTQLFLTDIPSIKNIQNLRKNSKEPNKYNADLLNATKKYIQLILDTNPHDYRIQTDWNEDNDYVDNNFKEITKSSTKAKLYQKVTDFLSKHNNNDRFLDSQEFSIRFAFNGNTTGLYVSIPGEIDEKGNTKGKALRLYIPGIAPTDKEFNDFRNAPSTYARQTITMMNALQDNKSKLIYFGNEVFDLSCQGDNIFSLKQLRDKNSKGPKFPEFKFNSSNIANLEQFIANAKMYEDGREEYVNRLLNDQYGIIGMVMPNNMDPSKYNILEDKNYQNLFNATYAKEEAKELEDFNRWKASFIPLLYNLLGYDNYDNLIDYGNRDDSDVYLFMHNLVEEYFNHEFKPKK